MEIRGKIIERIDEGWRNEVAYGIIADAILALPEIKEALERKMMTKELLAKLIWRIQGRLKIIDNTGILENGATEAFLIRDVRELINILIEKEK